MNELRPSPDSAPAPPGDLATWKAKLSAHIGSRHPDALSVALPALNAHPADPEILLLATIAALLDERPEQSLRYLQRFTKRFTPLAAEDQLLRAVALAEQGIWTQAAQVLRRHGARRLTGSIHYLPCGWELTGWFQGWIRKIERAEGRRTAAASPRAKRAARPPRQSGAAARAGETPPPSPELDIEAQAEALVPPLRRDDFQIPLAVSLPEGLDELLTLAAGGDPASDREPFLLRYELTQLSLWQGFDELLCLPLLRGVDTYWYQVETVRKVLKQFRGRVLLADEVGLGKTIEAGMVLKEYLLRGMAERVLILTPATLVGQWQEEMAIKFEVSFATSYDALLRSDPPAFWSQPRVIASIATARRAEHQALLAAQRYDVVVVDEAHHLKNRATANWKLVDALNKRFLLLLSATPVQNSLVEIYNLLTLLKPGIFKTEKEFRAGHMTSGKPRLPANRDRMRDLMRDVMIRNTRALVDVRLPPRHAATLRLEPTEEEAACYRELTRLVQAAHRSGSAHVRLALRHLLAAAGSTPTTAAGAIGRFAEANRAGREWRDLQARYAALPQTGKEQALSDLLRRNPDEKKMVFVRYRETLARLAEQVEMPCVLFEGGMTGPEKDAAVARFRDEAPLLFCTESGGEGRNLQFCNTLVNFDLPWNPMAIEQRIGRLHRIGQAREVFVFNLVVRDTIEEQVLRILDEKINMFELVVGEIGSILGELEEGQDFAELVFAAWVETAAAERASAFEALGQRLAAAKSQYESVKALDDELFGEEFVTG